MIACRMAFDVRTVANCYACTVQVSADSIRMLEEYTNELIYGG